MRTGRTWRWVAATTLVLAAALGAPGRAHAETEVSVVVGVNGHSKLGTHTVLRITVRADELIEGEVRIASERSTTTGQIPVQVPAGTTKDLLVVVPTGDGGRFEIEVRDGDDLVATGRANQRTEDDVELVGVLPRLAARVETVPEQTALGQGLGRAELASIGTDVLDLGPVALEGYDTLIGAGGDLGALSEDQRRAVFLWVNAGGRLLLDDAEGLNVLPEPWRPAPDQTYSFAGRGEVRLLDGAAADGEWAAIIEPSPLGNDRLDGGNDIFIDPQSSLAEQSGVVLPALTPLMIVLAVYGLVVGPLVYLALRRTRRLTLGWFVVPLLAVLTAGGVVAAGGRFRSSGHPATSTFIDASPAGAVALSNVLTFSRSGGDASVTLPARWALDGSLFNFFGDASSTATRVTPAADGRTRLEQRLEAGQVTTNAFTGELVGAPELALRAELTADGQLAGSVTNESVTRLRDVAVFAGGRGEEIGELAPGASAEWSIDAPSDVPRFVSPAGEVWPAPFQDFGDPAAEDEETNVDFGIYGAASLKWDLYPTGVARVVGWSDDVAPAIDPGAGTTSRTAVSTTAVIAADGQPPHPATVRAAIVRSPFGPNGNGNGTEEVYRYVVPPGSDASGGLVLTAAGRLGEVSFWDGTEWTEVTGEDDEWTVPDEAVREGVVLARTVVDEFAGELGQLPTLRAAQP